MRVFLLFFKCVYFVTQMRVVCQTRVQVVSTQRKEAKSQHRTISGLSEIVCYRLECQQEIRILQELL